MRRIQAKPGMYRGEQYQSQLEIRMAKILDANKVEFRPHIKFETENGKTREVDFMLKTLVKPVWSSDFIIAIETKGRLDNRDWIRLKELQAIGIPTFIATSCIVDFWQREKFIEYQLYERKSIF